jgi:TBC1 domain family protein 5
LKDDEALRAEIFQDVERCMPENLFFREPSTQNMMLDILFVYCKINSDIGYRQGMHELLAPFLWVLEQDAIKLPDHPGSIPTSASNIIMMSVSDATYVEHDAFTLFSIIMQPARAFYEPGPEIPPGSVQTKISLRVSPIVDRSKTIHLSYLAAVDPELSEKLVEIEVLPQVFIM